MCNLEEIKRIFDKSARSYDDRVRAWDSWVYKAYSDGLRAMSKEIKKAVRETQASSILDVGCGTGNLLDPIRKTLPGPSYTGIDLSEEMLKIARAKYCTERFIQTHLEQYSQSEDIVVVSYVLHHYSPDELPKVLSILSGLSRKSLILVLDIIWNSEAEKQAEIEDAEKRGEHQLALEIADEPFPSLVDYRSACTPLHFYMQVVWESPKWLKLLRIDCTGTHMHGTGS